jgi:transcriptional regulator with XRE-family HTH domain
MPKRRDPLRLPLGPIASTIQKRRKAKHLTQLQLATKAGISRNWLSQIESGATPAGPALLTKLLAALGSDDPEAEASSLFAEDDAAQTTDLLESIDPRAPFDPSPDKRAAFAKRLREASEELRGLVAELDRRGTVLLSNRTKDTVTATIARLEQMAWMIDPSTKREYNVPAGPIQSYAWMLQWTKTLYVIAGDMLRAVLAAADTAHEANLLLGPVNADDEHGPLAGKE